MGGNCKGMVVSSRQWVVGVAGVQSAKGLGYSVTEHLCWLRWESLARKLEGALSTLLRSLVLTEG